MRAPLEQRFWPKVRKTDGCWIWIAAKQKGYGAIVGDGEPKRVLRAHRVSYEWAYGSIPDGLVIDHLCCNRACVRPEHLRVATFKQNNERGRHPVGVAGHRGVTWDKARRKWCARLSHGNRTINGGRFGRLEDAIVAADALRARLHSRVPASVSDPVEGAARLFDVPVETYRQLARRP